MRAGVAWYGRLNGDRNALQPLHPIDGVMQLKAPVLGLYGALDTSISQASVNEMSKALQNAGEQGVTPATRSRIKVYPGAAHAFHADYRASYNREAAEDGWRSALGWFEQNGLHS